MGMETSETECLEALRAAAAELGESPTKADYEELGMTPASATIIRVVGGWNEAKEKAGLEINPSTGERVGPKPDGVELPDGTDWDDLSVDQRWHYRNQEWNTERTLQRRARLRSWVNDCKRERGCSRCERDDYRCLEFHHTAPEAKDMAIGEMITHGYGRETLGTEMEKCTVLCANCHRREHYDLPEPEADGRDRERTRAWLYDIKHDEGCQHCGETDPRSLVFHHTGEEKTASVASMLANGRSQAKIERELEQCEVICANCHRKAHFDPPT